MHLRTAALALLALAAPGARAASGGDEARAEDAYQAARKAYYDLKEDEGRRRFRHNWLNVAHKFDQVHERWPKTERAPDALFTSAELHNDLSRISRLNEDLKAAISRHQGMVDRYPKSRLADDSALALARIFLERTGELDRARRILDAALNDLPKGDMRKDLLALEKTLPTTSAAPAKGKRVAARRADPEPEPESEADEPERPELLAAIARVSRPGSAASAAQTSRPPEPKPDPKEARTRLRAAVRAGGDEFTLAEQLGLKVRRVVIDAGHGGHDTGAIGKSGTKEKDVALAIARRVGEILAGRGLEVVLTRDDDTYIRLEDRTRIANEAKGDLFISIHCNASEFRRVRGIETFTLNVAADRYSIRLAARENSASEKSISDLQFILADLATKANTEESERLARRVQSRMVSTLRKDYKKVKDLGIKQALFYVLLGAKMPAILVETSFLSNALEEKRLASKDYQEALAQAISGGVQAFLEDRGRLARVVD